MLAGIFVKGVYYMPGRAAAALLKLGRTSFYQMLRIYNILDNSNRPTRRGKEIGVIEVNRGTKPDWVDAPGAPYFSDESIESIKKIIQDAP